MKTKVYIRSSGMISPQNTFGKSITLENPVLSGGNRMNAIEPDYKQILDAKSIRRMSRIIKMATAAAQECMDAADLKQPDAIITGTAYGCLEDTITFLERMVENQEEMLTPTAFIQSTHNSIGAQIALTMKCHGYNNTFVHRGHSFEQALLDAMLLIAEGEMKNILVGGVDEITDASHAILSRFGLFRREPVVSDLITNPGKGTIQGEGAGFFLLSSEASGDDMATLDHLALHFKPSGTHDLLDFINQEMEAQQISIEDIDLFVLGLNGDLKNDSEYDVLQSAIRDHQKIAFFKQLSGEYPTAVSFALWLAATTLKNKKLPFSGPGISTGGNMKRVLICNAGLDGHHSLILLSAC